MRSPMVVARASIAVTAVVPRRMAMPARSLRRRWRRKDSIRRRKNIYATSCLEKGKCEFFGWALGGHTPGAKAPLVCALREVQGDSKLKHWATSLGLPRGKCECGCGYNCGCCNDGGKCRSFDCTVRKVREPLRSG